MKQSGPAFLSSTPQRLAPPYIGIDRRAREVDDREVDGAAVGERLLVQRWPCAVLVQIRRLRSQVRVLSISLLKCH